MKTFYFSQAPLIAAAIVASTCLFAEWLSGAEPAGQDSIDVIGHLALPGTTVNSIQTSTHWTKTLLELNDNQHRMLTVVDVTDPARPEEVEQLALPAQASGSSVETMVGNTVLLADGSSEADASHRSLSIVNFDDPEHPVVERRFASVSAMRKAAGGIIYVADADGLWILKQHEAPDKKLEASYRDYILYGTR